MVAINQMVQFNWLPVKMKPSEAEGAGEEDKTLRAASFAAVECGLFVRYKAKEYAVVRDHLYSVGCA